MRDQMEFDTLMETTGILSRIFVRILCLAKHFFPSGIRKIWLTMGVNLVRSGTISSCDLITSISYTSSGLVISFGTGEMIVISRYAYFLKRWKGSGQSICVGPVSGRDSI